MEDQKEKNQACPVEDYETPNIIGDIDTVAEEEEYLEKKVKIPVWIWVFLIIVVAVVALVISANQSPTITLGK